LLTARGAELFEFFRGVAILGFDEGNKGKNRETANRTKKSIKTIP
jgi:hypothetical protein